MIFIVYLPHIHKKIFTIIINFSFETKDVSMLPLVIFFLKVFFLEISQLAPLLRDVPPLQIYILLKLSFQKVISV